MDIIHYNMFGINKLKEENKELKIQNNFLKNQINYLLGEMKEEEIKFKEEISKLENIIRKKDQELSIQYEFNRLREKNSDTEKIY